MTLNLNEIIGNTTTEQPVADAPDMTAEEALSGAIDNLIILSQKLDSVDQVVASLVFRLETLEKHTSYLLTKDPEVGPKMLEIAEKIKAEEAAKKASDEQKV